MSYTLSEMGGFRFGAIWFVKSPLYLLMPRGKGRLSMVRAVIMAWVMFADVDFTIIAVNSSPPGQNGCHFADDISRCIFMNENFCILIRNSLKCIHKGPNDNNLALI